MSVGLRVELLTHGAVVQQQADLFEDVQLFPAFV